MTPAPPVKLSEAELLPCPFCGGGEMRITETPLDRMPRMDGKPSAIVSVEIRHWCGPQSGVVASGISFRGRDSASAVAAWNRRAALSAPLPEEDLQP